jgi:hypothetical protein
MTPQQLSDQPLSLEELVAAAADRSEDVMRADVIREAIEIIDGALTKMFQRELVSSSEVTNLLLDVRSTLSSKN